MLFLVIKCKISSFEVGLPCFLEQLLYVLSILTNHLSHHLFSGPRCLKSDPASLHPASRLHATLLPVALARLADSLQSLALLLLL